MSRDVGRLVLGLGLVDRSCSRPSQMKCMAMRLPSGYRESNGVHGEAWTCLAFHGCFGLERLATVRTAGQAWPRRGCEWWVVDGG